MYASPSRNKYRPSQATPISNFTLAGAWPGQKFLGSGGAVLAGKLGGGGDGQGGVRSAHQGPEEDRARRHRGGKGLKEKEPVGADEGENALVFGAGAR